MPGMILDLVPRDPMNVSIASEALAGPAITAPTLLREFLERSILATARALLAGGDLRLLRSKTRSESCPARADHQGVPVAVRAVMDCLMARFAEMGTHARERDQWGAFVHPLTGAAIAGG